jgi:serine phosphatase RsbU (regulator of sigma subunit)
MSRILIVEDEPAIQAGLKANLEFESHEVITASDGEQGYHLLRDHSPDLVILDLMLPKLSGYELCRKVRGEGYHGPILMLSARSEEADRVLGLDLGANDYVTKPFSLRELLARVRSLLRNASAGQEDKRRLEQEIRTAFDVQKRLFPSHQPEAAGLDYFGICRPALGVSGDYYDFIALPSGKLGLLLADVSGKGMAAALLGASAHAAMRAHAPALDTNCGEVLARVNRLLFETSAPERFVTMFYCVYDAATRTLSYANAGHVAPVLIRRDESASLSRLDSLTPPVGLAPKLEVHHRSLTLAPGDTLVIYSDGLPEALNEAEEEFGESPLEELFLRLRQSSAAGFCQSALEAVETFAQGARQSDDMTLIVASVR